MSERIVSMALHSATSAVRNDHPTTGSQQPHPELAAPGRPEEASAKSGAETGAVSMMALMMALMLAVSGTPEPLQ